MTQYFVHKNSLTFVVIRLQKVEKVKEAFFLLLYTINGRILNDSGTNMKKY